MTTTTYSSTPEKHVNYLFFRKPTKPTTLGYIKNKEFTCFPGFEEYVVDGIYLPNKNVVVSNNYITAKAAGATFDFAKEIIKYLTNEKTANKVINSVYYKG